jgi:hypothetical protein
MALTTSMRSKVVQYNGPEYHREKGKKNVCGWKTFGFVFDVSKNTSYKFNPSKIKIKIILPGPNKFAHFVGMCGMCIFII